MLQRHMHTSQSFGMLYVKNRCFFLICTLTSCMLFTSHLTLFEVCRIGDKPAGAAKPSYYSNGSIRQEKKTGDLNLN